MDKVLVNAVLLPGKSSGCPVFSDEILDYLARPAGCNNRRECENRRIRGFSVMDLINKICRAAR
jgi:hypothetical protein